MIEGIITGILGNDGRSKLVLYPVIVKLVDQLKNVEGFQVIDNIPWTPNDFFDVIIMVGKKLLPKLNKKGGHISSRFYENGILEFRLDR